MERKVIATSVTDACRRLRVGGLPFIVGWTSSR